MRAWLLLLLCFACSLDSTAAAVSCAAEQWCWDPSFQTVQYLVSLTPRTRAQGASFCAAQQATLATPSILAFRAMSSVAGAGPGWTSVTLVNGVSWISDQTNASADLSVWVLSPTQTRLYDCIVISNTSSVLDTVPCATSMASTVCQRSVGTNWVTIDMVALEYAFFDVRVTSKSDARAFCTNLNVSADIAYIPQFALQSVAGNVSNALKPGFSKVAAVGHDSWTDGNGIYWMQLFNTYNNEYYDPTGLSGQSGTFPVCTVWNVTNNTFSVQLCSIPVGVLCARFATPKTRDFCIRNATTMTGYKYLPTNWSTEAELYRGASIPDSDAACRRDLGNMTKFLDVPSLVSCFGSWAVVGVGTPLFQAKWIDGSVSPKTGVFATTGASSNCYAVSTIGPKAANITALNAMLDCSSSSTAAAICEYSTATVQFSASSKTLQMAPGCAAYVDIRLHTPLAAGVTVNVCPQLPLSAPLINATCVTFTSTSINIARAYIVSNGASSVTYVATCDAAHSSLCASSPTVVITTTPAAVVAASISFGSTAPTSLTQTSAPLSVPTVSAGSTVTLVLNVAAAAYGAVVNLTTSPASISGVTYPASILIPPSTLLQQSFVINITGTAATPSFVLIANFTSALAGGGCVIAPTSSPSLGASLARLKFDLTKTIVPDWTSGLFYAFGPRNLLGFSFSSLPTGAGSRSFACVRASTITNANVSSTIACVHSTSNSTWVQVELTHNSYAALNGPFSVIFDTYGTAASEYAQSRFVVNFTIAVFNMTVSGLEPLEFLDTNMTVTIQVPYLTPASESLNIYLFPNATATTAACPGLAPITGVASVYYFSTSTTLVQEFVPSGSGCITSGRLYLTLLGSLKSFFAVQYDLQDYTVNPGEYLVVQPTVTDLFVGAPPVDVTFSLPKAFSASGKILDLTILFGGKTSSTVALAAPSALSFASGGATSAVTQWTGLQVAANLRVDVTFSAASSSQFRAPLLPKINVRPRTTLTVSTPTAVTFFLRVWYTATVVFQVAPPSGMYTLVGFNTSDGTIECIPFNLTSAQTTLSGSMKFRALSSRLTNLTVQLTGPAAVGYILSPGWIAVPALSLAVDVIVTAPSILLVDAASCANCAVQFAISAAPTASDRIVVNLTTSKSLNASQTILTWRLGSTATYTVAIKPLYEDPSATLNYTVTSYAADGSLTPEANRSAEIRVVRIAVRQKGEVKASVWLDGDTKAVLTASTTIKVDRDAYLNVSVSRPPNDGTSLLVIPRFAGAVVLADIQPANATFTPTSPTVVQLRFRGLNVGSSSLVFDLFDTAAAQFSSPSDSILAGSQITLTVVDRTAMQVASDTPMPTVLVAGASPVVVVITFPVLPTFTLTASVTASPNVLVITPPILTWSPTSSLRQNFSVSANATSVVPVVVTVAPVSPLLSGYLGFTSSLTTQKASNITVTFPTDVVFCSETANVLINISTPVTGSVPLQILLNTNCPQCGVSPSNAQAYAFAGGGSVVSQNVVISYSTLAISTPQTVSVTVTVLPSTAATQYAYPSSFTGVITFIPRRSIYVLAPSVVLFYVGTPGSISILLSRDPDVGTFLRIADDGFRATQQAYWSGNNNSVGTNQSLWLKFSSPGTFTINFVITATNDVQKNRYIAPGSLTANVIPKITLAVVSTLRPVQVVGDANSQTIVVVLSRVPQAPLNATPQFTSPLGDIVYFTPPYVTWSALDTQSSLTRYLNVTGLRRGEITNFYFAFDSSLPEELAQSTTTIFASSLRFDALYSVQFVGSDAQAYVDGSTTRFINVSISQTGYFGVSLVPTFSVPGAIRFLTTRVDFYQGGPLWRLVNYTCEQPVVSGSIGLTWIAGTEFSPAIAGSVSFSIAPRIQASLISAGVALDNTSLLYVQTDVGTSLKVELQDFHANSGSTVQFTVGYEIIGDAPVPSFVSISPSTLVFQRSQLSQTFSLVTGSHKPFAFVLILTAPNAPQFAPGFNVTVNVSVSVQIAVTQFPSVVYTGSDNAQTFYVRPLYPPPATTFLDLVIVTDCSTKVATVTATTPLEWSSALSTAVPVQVVAESAGSCTVTIRRSPGTVPEIVAFYFTQTLSTVQAPTLIWANTSSRITPTLGVPYPFDFRAAQVNMSLYVVLPQSVSLTGPFNYTILGPGDRVTAASSFILTTDKTVDDEPLGVLSQYVNKENCELLHIDTPGDGHTINMAFGPCPNLIVLEGETLGIAITSLALGGVHPAVYNATVKLAVTKYTANIVPQPIKDGASALAAAAAITSALFASPMCMQAARSTVFMSLSNCPNDNWVAAQADLDWYQTFSGPDNQFGSYTDLGRYLFVAVINSVVLLLALLVHFLVCFGFYIQKRKGSTKTLNQVCGRLKFPGLTVVGICVWVLPTVNAALRVAFYSPQANYNVYGFLLVIPWAIILPAWLFRLLWINDQVTYDVSGTKESWRKFLLFRIMRPEGTWSHPNASFIPRYGALFSECRGAFRWYFGFEYLCTLFYAAAAAVEPATGRGCVTKAGAMTALLGVQMCAALLWRPFVRSFSNGLFGLFYALQFIAMIILTSQLSQRVRNETLQKGAVWLLVVSAVVMLAGGLWFTLVGVGLELSRRYGMSNKYSKKKRRQQAKKEAEEEERDDAEGDAATLMLSPQQPLEIGMARTGFDRLRSRNNDANNDDSDEDDDPEVQKAVTLLEERAIPAVGVFRTPLRGNEAAFSALRRAELDRRRAVLERQPTPPVMRRGVRETTTTVEADDGTFHTRSDSAANQAADSDKGKLASFNRFTVVEAIDLEML